MFDKITQAIRHGKVLHLPNALMLENNINFNTVGKLLNSNNYKNRIQINKNVGINENDIFCNPFQIRKVEDAPEIRPLHKIICNGLKHFNIDQADIFFSFKRSIGAAHVDEENSLILGVYNNAMYRFDTQDITIHLKPGDLLLSPSGLPHFALSYQERIILSWGLREKK
jgi:hypothetical protein